MQLELTKKQYQELLKATMIGVWIRESVHEERSTRGWEKIGDIESYLLSKAKDFDSDDLAENFQGEWIPSDELSEKIDEEREEYENFDFWHRLVIDLGQRDFFRTITKEDKKFMKDHDGMFPERVHELYEKYSEELEEHGIDRLEIVEKSK